MSYSVSQNTTFLTVAAVLQRAISFVYFIFIARAIGVENTGVYFFAIAFTTIFTVVADFGLGPVLTREAARFDTNSSAYLNTVLGTKLIFGVISYGVLIICANLLGYDALTKSMIYLSGITMFFDNIHATFYGILRAKKNLLFEGAGLIGSQFLTAIIGGVALYLGAPLYWLILAYTIPAGVNAIYAGFMARRILGAPVIPKIDFGLLQKFLVMAWPFAIAGLITRLYSYSDSIIMSKLLSPTELGYWSVPFKITFAFQFIPAALTASVYPAMSSFFITDRARVGELFVKATRYLFAVVFPLAFGLSAVAYPTLTTIYGAQYAPSVLVLRILLLSLIFGYVGFVTGATLNATDRQKTQTGLLLAALTVSVISNLILIPIWGIVGAAISAVIGNGFLAIAGTILVAKKIILPYAELWKYLWRTFIPAVIMGVIAYLSIVKISFMIVIPLVAIIYGILLFVFGAVDRDLLKRLFAKIC
ncbi:MAG: hypothetical protein A3J93_00655 [Candidatus Magasanikbacteria bacterium RIFOXYC2_FULL_42_28]|uniref:Uncharacterized protein n=1 Tax=Candidatus Magasanikbacteria bacterium RIFOXYC2_FULL_42_28 TaxID=1798704 RepID=A0A1F6NXK2_9BACT|nr:MAG: hypothetical protein A3J93_00655 [Candidatus Magasanikbacteria bacterium RIFOXYC2_FULL_42_28]